MGEDEREDSILEAQRQSLLDVIEDKNRAMNKKTLLHRMVLISKMYHNNFAEIGQYYERMYKEIQNQYQCEPVTGLLLLFPKHCIHVIEAGVEVLLEVVKDVKREEDAGTGNMEKSRIMIVSHDIPHRLFQHWSFRIIDIETPNVDLYEPTESPDKLVVDTLTQVLKLSNYIVRQQPKVMKNAADNLHEKVPELLPQQVVVGWLIENDFENITMPPQEYLDNYQKPFDVVLGGELLWPMPVRLFPYN